MLGFPIDVAHARSFLFDLIDVRIERRGYVGRETPLRAFLSYPVIGLGDTHVFHFLSHALFFFIPLSRGESNSSLLSAVPAVTYGSLFSADEVGEPRKGTPFLCLFLQVGVEVRWDPE